MSFGFKAINESSYVQIDSETPRLCAVEKGSYGDGTNNPTITFAQPFTTTEPPMLFIRPNVAGAGKQIIYQSVIRGGPGNWTGFSLQSSNVTWAPSGLWFSAVFASRGLAAFGMRLWGASSQLVYDSGAPPVLVTGVYSGWTYAGQEPLTIGSRWKWAINRAPAVGEYLLLNAFTLNMLSPSTIGTLSGIHVDYPSNQTVIYGTDLTVWTDVGHKPMLFARLTL